MPKTAGLGDNYYIDGTDISGDVNSLSKISGGPKALDVTGINQLSPQRLGGERDGGMDFTSWYNPGAGPSKGGTELALDALPTTDRIGTYFRGQAIGNDAASMVCKQLNYDPTRATDGSLSYAVSLQANGFGVEWGYQLTPGLRTDGAAVAASSANSLDTGGSLAFGGQAYFHLVAFTGTSVTLSIWDSADNVTFAAVAGWTTTALTTPQAFRDTIANNATVRRYIAVASVGTFSNAVFAVNAVKNLTAGQVF
jgi:hypothetical protein